MDHPEITHVSLCAGYGGIDLGLKRMLRGARTVAYAEIDEFASGVLAARMEGGQLDPAPIWPDVKSFPYSDFHGKVDILSAGYPCQPFSQAGLQLGVADPRHIWPAIATGIRLVRPGFVFLENVQGHLALGLDAVLRDLQRAGYRSTFGLFSAAEIGACHERRRVFVLAHSVCERGLVSFERVVSAIKDTGGESQTGRTPDGWSDHTGWAIEPCVRGGDDGAANRVDRLRLLGNGVVPAVAERAFRVLLAQLFL